MDQGKILVSACLCGVKCRYNGNDCKCDRKAFIKWLEEGRLIPVCPEVLSGFTTPRYPMELHSGRLITQLGADVTEQCMSGVEKTLHIAQENRVVLCVLKQNSPSCGSSVIYDGSFSGRRIPGVGVAAAALKKAGFRVISEEEIPDFDC